MNTTRCRRKWKKKWNCGKQGRWCVQNCDIARHACHSFLSPIGTGAGRERGWGCRGKWGSRSLEMRACALRAHGLLLLHRCHTAFRSRFPCRTSPFQRVRNYVCASRLRFSIPKWFNSTTTPTRTTCVDKPILYTTAMCATTISILQLLRHKSIALNIVRFFTPSGRCVSHMDSR